MAKNKNQINDVTKKYGILFTWADKIFLVNIVINLINRFRIMADVILTDMNKNEDEKSFFRLCEFDCLQVDKYQIQHNLKRWGLYIYDVRLKGSQIQLQINVPYAEMQIEVEEKTEDVEFFGKNVAKLSISKQTSPNDGILNYFCTKTIVIEISVDVKYLLFSTPYFYPHNLYLIGNKDYLYKKISYSINYLDAFIKAYIQCFQDGVPLIYLKDTREARNHYEIDAVLKEYLTISYVKTDKTTSTVFFHLLLETEKKTSNTNNCKYHQITIIIPREIRTGQVDFKFTANVI